MNPAPHARPQHAPSARELDDLDLLTTGALAPLAGYGAPETGVTLQVPEPLASSLAPGAEVELVDPEGVPLATVDVRSTYAGPGTSVGVVGDVHGRARREGRVFDQLYLTPERARAEVGPDSLTVACDRPPTAEDVERITATAGGRDVLLLALVGDGRPQGVSSVGLVRACLAAAELIPSTRVVAVPLSHRERAQPEVDERVLRAYAPGDVLQLEGRGDLPPAIADLVEADRPTGTRRGMVLFFTGLSGSGKSTVARGVRDVLVEQGHRTVTLLDGDVVRRNLSAGLTFSREDRETNIRRIGWVAAEIARHGGAAICSPIAPFAATRAAVRAMVQEAGAVFVLVHVATPLEECERRDRKGLYAKARRGEIPDFTGISSPYEEPTDADLTVDTTGRSVDEVVTQVLDLLAREGLVELDRSPVGEPAHG